MPPKGNKYYTSESGYLKPHEVRAHNQQIAHLEALIDHRHTGLSASPSLGSHNLRAQLQETHAALRVHYTQMGKTALADSHAGEEMRLGRILDDDRAWAARHGWRD